MLGLAGGCTQPHFVTRHDAGQASAVDDGPPDDADPDTGVMDPHVDVGRDGSVAVTMDSGPAVVNPAMPDAGRDGGGDDASVLPPPEDLAMRAVPAGSVTMGSAPSTPCRRTNEDLHLVVISRAFELMAAEVTQAEYFAQRGYTPSSSTSCGSDCPVENLSWHEAVAYCNGLSEERGVASCYDCAGKGAEVVCAPRKGYAGSGIHDCPGYRLPTEAEWELAYRAAGESEAAFYAAEAVAGCGEVRDPDADQVAWYAGNSGSPYVELHPVKQKAPNHFGLHDMAGNVAEWVHDSYVNNLGLAPVTDPNPPADPPYLAYRTFKGGFYGSQAEQLRRAYRGYDRATRQSPAVGFRCARTTP